MNDALVHRAQGCPLGQLPGDSLGNPVGFRTPGNIQRAYPEAVTDLADGET